MIGIDPVVVACDCLPQPTQPSVADHRHNHGHRDPHCEKQPVTELDPTDFQEE